MANILRGIFEGDDNGEDGYKGIAPVKQYPASRYGLYDIAGNVWNGAATGTARIIYETLSKGLWQKSKGPEDFYDPAERTAKAHAAGRIISVYRSILYKIYVGNKG